MEIGNYSYDFRNYYYNRCILLTAKSRSARGASRHPAFMDGSLTVSQMRLPCPLCGKMGLQSWTVVMAIDKLFSSVLKQSW